MLYSEQVWLPYPESYDISDRALKELKLFLECPTFHLSADYRKPDKTGVSYWNAVFDLVSVEDNDLFVELGVFKGTTATIIGNILKEVSRAAVHTPVLHAFDCFEGLPEKWRDLDPGTFSLKSLPKVPDNVKLIDGLFKDSLPHATAQWDDKKIALLHMDADLYSSTEDGFRELHQFFKPGTIIAFDEFALWPGFHKGKQSEFEALIDASEKYGFKYEYVMRGWDDEDKNIVRMSKEVREKLIQRCLMQGVTILDFIKPELLSYEQPKHSAREKAVIRIL